MAVASGQYDYTGPQQRQNGGAKPVYGPPQHEFGEPIGEPLTPQQPLTPQRPLTPQQPAEHLDETYTPKLFKHVRFLISAKVLILIFF